jgi:hypothetical protein
LNLSKVSTFAALPCAIKITLKSVKVAAMELKVIDEAAVPRV